MNFRSDFDDFGKKIGQGQDGDAQRFAVGLVPAPEVALIALENEPRPCHAKPKHELLIHEQ